MNQTSSSANTSRLLPVEPFDIIVFGATGDLALRKLMPALYHRWKDEQIPENSRIIGTARGKLENDEYRQSVRQHFEEFYPNEEIDEDAWAGFMRHLHYCGVDALNGDSPDWKDLAGLLDGREDRVRVFYLALPPGIYGPVARNIDNAGLKTDQTRIVLEKPIGTNYSTAQEVNDAVGAVFPEDSIFRIDHYLGKETVQNLLILRFTNSLLEPVWNSKHVDHVQITVAETVGAGERASYYDKAGALRDMVQNHLLQLLCLVAMEPPVNFKADAIRNEKIKVLQALRPITQETIRQDTVRGQYKEGAVKAEPVRSYADEVGEETNTETFAALKAHVDNWRWSETPFYLRTGKRMSERWSEIVIQFKQVNHLMLENESGRIQPARLVIRLQPDEGVKLMLMTKDPGPGGMRLRYVPLNLSYAETFSGARYPDAYERLLMAVVRNDLGLFMRRDEVEAAWNWIDTVLESWQKDDMPVQPYAAGTDGPVQAATLLDRDGREWLHGV
jgi:glucose-6-phosphate 1-dehydrogenase